MKSPDLYCQNENCPKCVNNRCDSEYVYIDENGRCKTQDTVRDARNKRAKKEQQQPLTLAQIGA